MFSPQVSAGHANVLSWCSLACKVEVRKLAHTQLWFLPRKARRSTEQGLSPQNVACVTASSALPQRLTYDDDLPVNNSSRDKRLAMYRAFL